MSYAKAIAKMERVPEGARALLREIYFDGKNCCAVGLICPTTRQWGDADESVRRLLCYSNVRAELRDLGLDEQELIKIQEINDSFEGSDEERFERVLSKLRELEENNK